jgi:hypothetical protein
MMRGARTAVVALVAGAALLLALGLGAFAGLRLIGSQVDCAAAVDILVATVHTYPDQVEAAANYLVLNCPDLADPAGVRNP